jgi:hypothetical protein
MPGTDPYAYWRGALATAGDGGKLTKRQVADLGGITMEPRCGFWRKPMVDLIDGKRVKRPSLPVAIWQDADGFKALIDGKPADAEETWSWVSMTPISEETYRAVAERREWWPEGVAA